MFKRLVIFAVNIIFPPFGILLLCGPETDLIISCLLFICAVIPSHIHAFYVSVTYFNRKKKVRKGIYPGDWRRGIYSEKVQYGGATRNEYLRLKAGGREKRERSRSRSRRNTRRIEEWDDGFDKLSQTHSYTSAYSRPQMAHRPTSMTSTGGGVYTHDWPPMSHRASGGWSAYGQPQLSRNPSRRSGNYQPLADGGVSPSVSAAPVSRTSTYNGPSGGGNYNVPTTETSPVSPILPEHWPATNGRSMY